MEFRLATGNAGTGMYQRGTFEHGCEYVPVARRNQNYAEIPSAPFADIMWHPLLTDSADILSKQVKRQFIIKKKWTTKNSWHFTSKKIKPTSNTTKFLYP